MIAIVPRSDWQQGQDALRKVVGRVAALLRSGVDPAAHAVGQWSRAEVAMHLSQAWVAVPGLARKDLSPVYEVVPGLTGVGGDSLIEGHVGPRRDNHARGALGPRAGSERAGRPY